MAVIHGSQPALTLRAGYRAMQRLQEQPLRPEDVHVIPGAAGGPKALGISGLDKAIFGDWLPRAPQPRSLIGASIGSWRFAAIAASDDPRRQLEKLAELYTVQRFSPQSDMADISRLSQVFLDELLGGSEDRILDNPWYRVNILIVKSRGLLASDTRGRLTLGLMQAVISNMLSRRLLGYSLERGIVHDPRLAPPLGELTDFPTHNIALTRDNLQPALLASASIPMVMSGVSDIPGAPEGVYRDGGLLDYHLDLPWEQPGIVLYPHFTDKVIPGWLDKGLPWRRGDAERLKDVLLISPSRSYLESLPDGKLPDRKDFQSYGHDNTAREDSWRKAIAESDRLGDEFLQLVETGRLSSVLQPLT